MTQFIKYEGKNIVMEILPVSAVTRVIVGLLSLVGLFLGMRGSLQFAEMLLNLSPWTENNIFGLLVTIIFLVISIPGILLSFDSGKILYFDLQIKEACLRKRYLFKTFEKRFPFQSLDPCFVEQDVDLIGVWYVRLKLPDKTRIGASSSKKSSEMWRDRINVMIG